MPNTPKQTTITLKPQKTNPKTPFCHVQKQPTIFHKFFVFQHTIYAFEKLCLAENTIKIVFSETKKRKKNTHTAFQKHS